MIYEGNPPSFDEIIAELTTLKTWINQLPWQFTVQFPPPHTCMPKGRTVLAMLASHALATPMRRLFSNVGYPVQDACLLLQEMALIEQGG